MIYAKNLHDAYFAQGFNAATQRLWQMDLWRKRGMGLLSRDFGAQYIAQDRAARLFLYRGDMDAEWKSYVADVRQFFSFARQLRVADFAHRVGRQRRRAND